MERLSRRLKECRESGRKAMGIFVTCGFPSGDLTVPILQAVDRAGADFIELGMPFSDPLAEGKPIQHASEVALSNGTSLHSALAAAAAFRTESQTPLLLMGYINPLFRYGLQDFCKDASAAGVDGLILPDVPPEEAGELASAAAQFCLGLVFLIAPNTPDERIRHADRHATGFVYAISFTGLTGSALSADDTVQQYLIRARAIVTHPLLVGFGIRDASDARRMSRNTDGFIVGSALVREIDRIWELPNQSDSTRIEAVESFVRGLRPDGLQEHAL